MPDLLHHLKNVFGYPQFRPLQREIIEASMAGRDVFALLPTGGGKSLCFQLPALVREGLTVVVSPLIALMKDQVDQLQTAGVKATFLNSSLTETETRKRLAGLHDGKYRLLYAAPERLLMDHWKENLQAWNVSAIAIDEAHCISEWGHDFRPEYRKLSQLRRLLPDVPLMALTATATERVRADIVRHLHLREPEVFVGSFNRPNLTYRVLPKDGPSAQILQFIKKRPGDSGIVYCATRAATERVADALTARGVLTRAYHAGLSAKARSEAQELFLRDEVRIICATIAFGMGINKPNVRWVIHHDLPKNIEGYYQETGRAGRDSLPSNCLLLLSTGDVSKQRHFIDEMRNEEEKRVATRQLQQMLAYAESAGCRRKTLLAYFGETFPEDNCGGCDNCLEPRATYDATVPAQKFLSCLVRIRQAGRFGVGANHVIEILTGATTEKVRRWGHDKLTTYGIGRDMSRSEWAGIGRELLQLGLVAQSDGQYPTLEITPAGMEALRSRSTIKISRPMAPPPGVKAPKGTKADAGIECDEVLFDALKRLRKRLADEHAVPAYVIFGDATLRHMAREYPVTPEGMAGVFGVGERKLEQFGQAFMDEIALYLASNPRRRF